MVNIYKPGEGFFAGIYAFSRGPKSSQNTFLQGLAQKTEPRYATEIEIAVENGKIAVADEVGYGGNANLVVQDKFKREVYGFPLYNEVMRITGSDLQKRPPTKNPNATWSVEEAQAYWVERKFGVLYSRLQTRREALISEMLLTGKITSFNRTESLDLKRKASKLEKTLSDSSNKWDSSDRKHDPLKDIAELCMEIAKESGIRPKGIVMDGSTYEKMRSSIRFLETASVTFSDVRVEQSKDMEHGAILAGTLIAGGCMLEIWIYNGVYEDVDGKMKQFVPSGKVLIGDFKEDNPYLKWYFGATDALYSHIELAKNLNIPEDDTMEAIMNGEIVPTHWVDRNCLEIGLQSAMLPLPSDINMFGVLTTFT